MDQGESRSEERPVESTGSSPYIFPEQHHPLEKSIASLKRGMIMSSIILSAALLITVIIYTYGDELTKLNLYYPFLVVAILVFLYLSRR